VAAAVADAAIVTHAVPDLSPFRVDRSAPWREVDDCVVIEIPRPEVSGLRGLGDLFNWWSGPRRLRLDDLGSAVWHRCDGATTVAQIVAAMAAERPDDAEAMNHRVGLFLALLQREGLVRFATDDDPHHAAHDGRSEYSSAAAVGSAERESA
jgi:hypothetical protein